MPLDRQSDCRVRRYRPGQRVHLCSDAASTVADGRELPLLVVLRGVAVVRVGGVVMERVGPGGCVGGGQFVLQVPGGGRGITRERSDLPYSSKVGSMPAAAAAIASTSSKVEILRILSSSVHFHLTHAGAGEPPGGGARRPVRGAGGGGGSVRLGMEAHAAESQLRRPASDPLPSPRILTPFFLTRDAHGRAGWADYHGPSLAWDCQVEPLRCQPADPGGVDATRACTGMHMRLRASAAPVDRPLAQVHVLAVAFAHARGGTHPNACARAHAPTRTNARTNARERERGRKGASERASERNRDSEIERERGWGGLDLSIVER